jgi:phage terminase large subunit-like protein
MKDYCKIATSYIEDVLSGRIVTCEWTRKACQRQKDDLARDWEYVFDPDAANTVCSFLELLTHIKGDKGGQRLRLEPWQAFCITTLFGWKLKSNPARRRFRRFFLECGKNQGKSFLSSGIALFMMAADDEPGAESVCAARATDQARLVFDVARDMCRANPKLCETFGIGVLQHSIIQKSSTSKMFPVSAQGKSLAGKAPHYASVDELWSHRDRTVLDEMELGINKRTNSLLSSIGHAGDNLSSVGYEQHVAATKMLSGEHKDERTLAVIYSAEGFDWRSNDALRAANPNLGVSVYEDTLKEARDRAINLPAMQSAFKSHNLCLWEGADSAWIEPTKLSACRQKNLRMEDFKYWHLGEHPGVSQPNQLRPFVVGLDLASRQDLAAVIYCTTGFLDGVQHYYLFGKYYLPTETVATSPISQYRGWAARGLLVTHPGPSNDYNLIEADILELYRQHLGYGAVRNADGFKFVAGAYDEWQAESLRCSVEAAGIKTIPFKKNAKSYSPVMDWFTSLVLQGRIHFPHEDEILFWCINNVACHRDNNDNLFPLKKNKDPLRKIDGAVAMLYALRCAMADNGMLLAPPENDGVKVTFIMADNTVQQTGPDGKLHTLEVPNA